jgi:glutamate synthase domain-containing protein 2
MYENARSTTGTATRVKDVSPLSGMCPICIRECSVLCEISKSAFRGREVLYPSSEYFGRSTSAANKDFFMDWSYFQILVDVIGAEGIEPYPAVALFENVDVSTSVGGIPLKIPVLIAGLESTAVAKQNWESLAMGCALSGTIMTVGENVCGMDMQSKYTNGKVQDSSDMKFRVESYRKYWDGKHGDIVVQTNVEDQRGGVDVYLLSKLDVNIIERKWGQGAKAIGGEVRIHDLAKAQELKRRGYLVLPDPEDKHVIEAFKSGSFKTFERHSRVGFPEFKGFIEDVEWLRDQGSKKVFLKTSAYRPEVVAFTFKCASEAKIDMLTFDGQEAAQV